MHNIVDKGVQHRLAFQRLLAEAAKHGVDEDTLVQRIMRDPQFVTLLAAAAANGADDEQECQFELRIAWEHLMHDLQGAGMDFATGAIGPEHFPSDAFTFPLNQLVVRELATPIRRAFCTREELFRSVREAPRATCVDLLRFASANVHRGVFPKGCLLTALGAESHLTGDLVCVSQSAVSRHRSCITLAPSQSHEFVTHILVRST